MQYLKKGADWRLFLLLAGLFPASAYTDPACSTRQFDEIARVKYVHDGDTVHLQDGRKVRLIGINTPELARDDLPDQAFAREARTLLNAAIASSGDRVGLVFGSDRHDRYKRTLAHLFSANGENLQSKLLQQGLATAIAHPPNLAYTACYRQQELAARCARAGIWSDPGLFVQASRLDTDQRGFHLITGEVERISRTDKGVRIFIANLMLGIHHENLAEFDPDALAALPGKTVTVRGWLHPATGKQKKKFDKNRTVKHYMRIRHPSAIEVKPADGGFECQNIRNN